MTSKWTAAAAFRCVLGLVVVSYCLSESFRIAFHNKPAFAYWIKHHSYFAEFSFNLLHRCLWIAVAYFCSRAPTARTFIQESGLQARVSAATGLLAIAAVGWGALTLFLIRKGWTHQNTEAKSVFLAGLAVWLPYFLDSTIISPFVEETVLRGFLYQAFRGTFGTIPSTSLVTMVQMYYHWGLISRDNITLLLLLLFSALMCFVRERTKNTWNCVAFHVIYNAVVLAI